MEQNSSKAAIQKGWSIYKNHAYITELVFYMIAALTSIISYCIGSKSFDAFFLMTILPSAISHILLTSFFYDYYKEEAFLKNFFAFFSVVIILLMAIFLVNLSTQSELMKWFVTRVGKTKANVIIIVIMSLSILENISLKMAVNSLSKKISKYFENVEEA